MAHSELIQQAKLAGAEMARDTWVAEDYVWGEECPEANGDECGDFAAVLATVSGDERQMLIDAFWAGAKEWRP